MAEPGNPDIHKEALSILSLKAWEGYSFDDFCEMLNEQNPRWAFDNESKDLARKFYDDITPQWFEEKKLSPDHLQDRALKQYIRMAMLYGFVCGMTVEREKR